MQEYYSREKATRLAFASARMEGFTVTEQTKRDCERLLDGKVSATELVREIIARAKK